MRATLVFLLLACRTAPPPVTTAVSEPYEWERDRELTQTQADARCSAEEPSCGRPYAWFKRTPSKCGGEGAGCLDDRIDGRWSCGCHQCLLQRDCEPGALCTVQPDHGPNVCVRQAPAESVDASLGVAPSSGDWRSNGNITQADGEKRCAREQPKCRWPFADYRAPESPCAHKGTRCMEPMPPGRWTCACHQCAGDSDCPKGHHCVSSGPPCARERYANVCREGPRPPPVDCFEPPPP